jgi:hypothetical protein
MLESFIIQAKQTRAGGMSYVKNKLPLKVKSLINTKLHCTGKQFIIPGAAS